MDKIRMFKSTLFLSTALVVSAFSQAQVSEPREFRPLVASNPLAEEFVIQSVIGRETPHLISDAKALQFSYSIIISQGKKGENALAGLAAHIGITESDMRELREIANSATLAADRDRRISIWDFCNTAEFIVLSEAERDEDILQATLNDFDEELENSIENFFHTEAARLLEPQAHSVFLMWLENEIKPSITDVQVDYIKRDKALNRNPFDRFRRLCESN